MTAPSLHLSELSYAVVDVETTGGSPGTGHRITEIGVVIVREGKIVQVYEQMVNPEHYISSWITQLTGISETMVWDQPKFAEIAPDIVTLLAGNVFVAHNATFDWRFVSAELQRVFDKTPTARTLCTVRLARMLLPHLPRKSLDYVAHHYGVRDIAQRYALKRDCRHSAAGDAVVTAHCLLHLLNDANSRGLATWDDLAKYGASSARRSRRRTALPTSTLDDRTA
ncbi:MAG TPA: exonuclease domain-containing protein [Gemmatimonadaceae bacterium]|nr:exonuclease domain-containing protein [Gemmatimonadaceae bacterium]